MYDNDGSVGYVGNVVKPNSAESIIVKESAVFMFVCGWRRCRRQSLRLTHMYGCVQQ